jgi:hypothetical protein
MRLRVRYRPRNLMHIRRVLLLPNPVPKPSILPLTSPLPPEQELVLWLE